MHFEPNLPYHVYNRGNNKQLLFFTDANNIFFLQKIKNEWKPYCDILCYCLMPNHFHFMLVPNEEGCKYINLGGKETHMQNLSKTIGKTLSSYTKAINIQNNTTGNLFQKKTKAKLLQEESSVADNKIKQDYSATCFHYIHQNPLQAGLVNNLSNWIYSSYLDYYDGRNGSLINKSLAMNLLAMSAIDFKKDAIMNLDNEIIKKLF
jgi:putative transposase